MVLEQNHLGIALGCYHQPLVDSDLARFYRRYRLDRTCSQKIDPTNRRCYEELFQFRERIGLGLNRLQSPGSPRLAIVQK